MQATAASDQIESARIERLQRRDFLRSVITELRRAVKELPGERDRQQADRVIRRVVLWQDSTVKELYLLAPEFGVSEKGAVVIPNLRWLAEKVRDVQTTDPRQGYSGWSDFPWGQWENALRTVTEMLDSMHQDIELVERDPPA